MEENVISFFKELSEAFGPSGFEREPAKLLKNYVSPYCDSVETDRLGSLLFSKKGSDSKPVILIPGHLDEVGFVVSGISKEGYLMFTPVGGWFDQVLLAQRVIVRTRSASLPGVIASKPPHILPAEERNKVVKQEKMYIDIGAATKEEAVEMGVVIGDPIVPDSRFSLIQRPQMEEGKRIGDMTLAMGKAFDDRVGALIAAEVVRRLKVEDIDHPNTVVGAGTVQEEVGLRGARTTAWLTKPDVCLTLDVDIAYDIPGIDPDQALTKTGKGPSILTFDASMVPNQVLKQLVIDTAEECSIPYQLSHMRRGGTDAGAIHISNAGCPSLVFGIPTRHIHSHVGLLSIDDVEHLVSLLIAVIKKLDAQTVDGFTSI